MMGILFANLFGNFGDFTRPLLVSVLIVSIARILSIYPVLGVMNIFAKKDQYEMAASPGFWRLERGSGCDYDSTYSC